MGATDLEELCRILYDVLQVDGRKMVFTPSTSLLGSLPEFDSMAVVSVITAVEDGFGIVIDDDEIDAEIFETIGSLHKFIQEKIEEEYPKR